MTNPIKVNDYVKLNELSAVYRVAAIRGDRAHLVPAPERAGGARIDRGWFDIEGLSRDNAR